MKHSPEPRAVFQHFEAISRIPRGSGNEKAVSDYIAAWAKARKLWVHQDAVNNLILKKPGTPGYEAAAPLLLQGHLDMVCEKTAESSHNFETDPLRLVLDGDWLRADDTTLGADNGIAVAMALALLESSDIPHPPLEVLLTVDEEVGMRGASQFDPTLIQARRMLNLDEEQKGLLTLSCAGGARAEVLLTLEVVAPQPDMHFFRVTVDGLLGGHSGVEIGRQRANAARLMGRVLWAVQDRTPLAVAGVAGGSKENVILNALEAVVGVADPDALQDAVAQLQRVLQSEYAHSDPGIRLQAVRLPQPPQTVWSQPARSMAALNLLPYGVLAMSQTIEGLVQTSCNVGAVETTTEGLRFVMALRSSIASQKEQLKAQITQLTLLLGGTARFYNDYPAWEYREHSPLRQLMSDAHTAVFGVPPVLHAIHAGLECGIISQKLPDMDMVALGPDIENAHAPTERLGVSATQEVWRWLLAALASMTE